MQGVCKLQFPGKRVATATDDAIGEWSVSGANGWNLATYIYILIYIYTYIYILIYIFVYLYRNIGRSSSSHNQLQQEQQQQPQQQQQQQKKEEEEENNDSNIATYFAPALVH